MAARQGRGARAASSTACCARWSRGCAWSRCCCGPTCRRAWSGCSRARRDRLLAGGRAAGRRGGRARQAIEPLCPESAPSRCFPKDAGSVEAMIDSHTHLDLCEPPNAELVAAADAAGVTRMLTVGIDGASCRAALAAAEDFPQVYAAIGRHPNAATGLRRRRPGRAARARRARALRGDRRDGLDFYRDGAPRADQERAFAAQIALARETGKPLVIHSRAADAETLAQLGGEARGRERGDALLLDARAPARSAWSAAMRSPSRATSPTRAPPISPTAARAGARRAPAGRDRRPLPDAPGRAQAAQPAGVRRPHGRLPGRAARRQRWRSSARRWSATRRACSAGCMAGPRRAGQQ